MDEALEQVDAWLGAPASTPLAPSVGRLNVLSGLLRSVGRAGNLTMDAHLAAIALEHGATTVSFDRDVDRFDGRRTLVPGAA